MAKGSRVSEDTCAANRRQVSATLRPIGPCTESGVQPIGRRSVATRPGEGRKPTTPQNAAGMRRLPPVSEPVQVGSIEVASATADPPDEPPQMRAGSKGLPVGPQTGLLVLAPAPNSGTFVLPTTMAPARRTAATIRSSFSGT